MQFLAHRRYQQSARFDLERGSRVREASHCNLPANLARACSYHDIISPVLNWLDAVYPTRSSGPIASHRCG
jgi:hypothetical protein